MTEGGIRSQGKALLWTPRERLARLEAARGERLHGLPNNWEQMGNEAYAASCGTYLWSSVTAADIRSGFTHALMDIAQAHRYRDRARSGR